MRKRLILTLFMAVLLLSGCAGWTINGIPGKKFINADPKEYTELVGGVAVSFLFHWLGHVAYYEINGIDWHQDGLKEISDHSVLSNSQVQMIGRSGFLGQLVVGTILNYSRWNNSIFATGYHLGSSIEVIGYPITSMGDYKLISDYGGNGNVEYGFYSLWSLYLLEPSLK